MATLATMWEDGVYFGQRAASGECIIGTPFGVETTRNVHRKPEEQRWVQESSRSIGGVPWRRYDGDPEQDGAVTFLPPEVRQLPVPETVIPKRVYIKKEDIAKAGFTTKCPGCRDVLQRSLRSRTRRHAARGSRMG